MPSATACLRTAPAWVGGAWLILWAAPVAAQAGGGPELPAAPPIPVDTFTLENGLHVVVAEDRSAPLVAVNLTWRVGSAHEPNGRFGFAHLFEHLLQYATENLAPGEAGRRVEAVGGRWTARTTRDRTVFAHLVPSNALEMSLWLHAEQALRPSLTDGDFEAARRRVLQERQMSVEGRPYARAALAVESGNTAWAPYRHPVIGWGQDLETATPGDARSFHQRYTPGNATLVVAGDAAGDSVRTLVTRYFGGAEAGSAMDPLPDPPAVPLDRPSREVVLEDSLATDPLVYLGFEIPPAGHPDEAALRVLARILVDGGDGWLEGRLVADRGSAARVTVGLEPGAGPSRMTVGALAVPGGDPDSLVQAVEEELRSLAGRGPTSEEVARARSLLTAEALEARSRVESRAEALQRARLVYGSATEVNREVAALQGVTPGSVQGVARRYLTPGNRTTVLAVPAGSPGGGR